GRWRPGWCRSASCSVRTVAEGTADALQGRPEFREALVQLGEACPLRALVLFPQVHRRLGEPASGLVADAGRQRRVVGSGEHPRKGRQAGIDPLLQRAPVRAELAVAGLLGVLLVLLGVAAGHLL